MRLVKSLIIAFSVVIATTACSGIPAKPNVELCIVDIPRQQLICAPTGGVNDLDQANYKNISQYVKSHPLKQKIPLSQANKYIAFHPQAWEEITVYLKVLRDAAERRCQ